MCGRSAGCFRRAAAAALSDHRRERERPQPQRPLASRPSNNSPAALGRARSLRVASSSVLPPSLALSPTRAGGSDVVGPSSVRHVIITPATARQCARGFSPGTRLVRAAVPSVMRRRGERCNWASKKVRIGSFVGQLSLCRVTTQDSTPEMEQLGWPGSSWLLLSFSPFPVLNHSKPPCTRVEVGEFWCHDLGCQCQSAVAVAPRSINKLQRQASFLDAQLGERVRRGRHVGGGDRGERVGRGRGRGRQDVPTEPPQGVDPTVVNAPEILFGLGRRG